MTDDNVNGLPGAASGRRPSTTSPIWREVESGPWRSLRDTLGTTESEADPVEVSHEVQIAEAYKQAYEEGLRRGKSTVESLIETYHQSIAEVEMLRDQILAQTEGELVELALRIAQQVLATDVETQRDFTTRMADHALRLLREADAVTLRVGPTDKQAIEAKHPELLAEATVIRIVEDASIKLGGVVAECNLGQVDATLESRLQQAATQLREAVIERATDESTGESGDG